MTAGQDAVMPGQVLPVSAVGRGWASVGGHLVDVMTDDPGGAGWTLRCGDCLAEVARDGLAAEDQPGLPISAALALDPAPAPDQVRRPFTLALGRIAPDCAHPVGEGRTAPGSSGPASIGFQVGRLPGRTVRADPVVMPGSWWVAAVLGTARAVTSEAFGIRHRAAVRTVRLQPCPGPEGPDRTRSLS